jgi:biotin carboxyl carrier protein
MKYTVRDGERTWQVEIAGEAPRWALRIDGRALDIDAVHLGDESVLTLLVDRESVLAHTCVVDVANGIVDVGIGGKNRRLEVLDELTLAARASSGGRATSTGILTAPMPGLIVAIRVQPGDRVTAGSPLVVMEAMKMQNELVAESAGVVREVRAVVGAAVESGAALVVLEPE